MKKVKIEEENQSSLKRELKRDKGTKTKAENLRKEKQNKRLQLGYKDKNQRKRNFEKKQV